MRVKEYDEDNGKGRLSYRRNENDEEMGDWRKEL